MSLLIGLMSGTSMDGVDAALVDVKTHRLIAGITRPYSESTQRLLQAVLSGEQTGLVVLSQLNTILGREFALAVHQLLETTGALSEPITAIGSHGQTLIHDPNASVPYTVQLACPHTISELTSMTVVADFRTRDVVLGGQGAPFAPLYHKVMHQQGLFGPSEQSYAVINVGGISNISILEPNQPVRGYDIGPGNALLDAWVQLHQQRPFDKNGDWAATGQVIEPLLLALLSDDYFQLAAPKSIDKQYFSIDWLADYSSKFGVALPEDIQATLLALTAATIVQALNANAGSCARVFVCGGGVHNQALMQTICSGVTGMLVDSTAAVGINPDYLEAMMMAWLAAQTLERIPLDLTHITGSVRPAVLGAIYPYSLEKNKQSPHII